MGGAPGGWSARPVLRDSMGPLGRRRLAGPARPFRLEGDPAPLAAGSHPRGPPGPRPPPPPRPPRPSPAPRWGGPTPGTPPRPVQRPTGASRYARRGGGPGGPAGG